MIHIKKFTRQLNKQQSYLKTVGINILDKHKLQFLAEQMINSKRFDKWYIIEWEDRTQDMKTWSNATKYFKKLVASEEMYANLVGGTVTKRSDERDGGESQELCRKKQRLQVGIPLGKVHLPPAKT